MHETLRPFINIFHTPIIPEEQGHNYVTQWTGEQVKYVCSTAFGSEETVWDIYYGESYHGVALLEEDEGLRLAVQNMDKVESYAFIMIKEEDRYRYSTARSDKVECADGSYVSGGRTYPVFEGVYEIVYLEEGEFKCSNL